MATLLMAKDTETRSLKDLIRELESWDATFSETRLDAQELKFDPEGIRHRGELLRLDEAKREHLFDKAGASGRYWRVHTPELQAAGLSAHAARNDFGSKPTLVLQEGRLVTIARGELYALENSGVMKGVEEALGRESEGLCVARIALDAEYLEVELVSPSKSIAVRPGDIVQSGIHVIHRRFGMEATSIQAFSLRLVCTNGMTRRECAKLRTRRLPVGFPNNRELQMEQVRRLTQQNWKGLQAQLEALRATSDRRANVEELLTRWLQRARISSMDMMQRIETAWREEGSDNTLYGAVNALSRVATHDNTLSARQRRVFASLAGLLAFSEVHLCKHCWSVLAASADRNGPA